MEFTVSVAAGPDGQGIPLLKTKDSKAALTLVQVLLPLLGGVAFSINIDATVDGEPPPPPPPPANPTARR